jgi:hemolysin III
MKKNKILTSKQIVQKEKINVITHGIGIILSILGTILLIFRSVEIGTVWHIISFSIFGISMIFLYSSSTIYHSIRKPRLKHKLNKLDHSSIYLLIAGTYTPFLFVTLKGTLGWIIFGVIWSMAIAGIIYKVFFYSTKYRKLSAILYLAMGWIIIFCTKSLIEKFPLNGWLWLIAGGVFYSSGILFYVRKKNLYAHNIWHLFVLGGTICHFFAIYLYVE